MISSTPTQYAVAEAMEDELKIMEEQPDKSYLRKGEHHNLRHLNGLKLFSQ